MSDVSDSSQRVGTGAVVTAMVLLLAGCHLPVTDNFPSVSDPTTLRGSAPASAVSNAPGSRVGAATVEAPDDGAADRLVVLPAVGRPAARAVIARLTVRGRGPKTGYARAMFGAVWSDAAPGVLWSGNGCSTRDDVLARDVDQVSKRDRCVVIAGRYVDPYSGKEVVFTKATAQNSPIDHVVPLAFAWQMGAAQWPAQKRLQFANDPLNLVTTTGSANTAKSDSDPASYLPPNKAIRCAYVERFALVALKFSVPVTAADKTVMGQQCQS